MARRQKLIKKPFKAAENELLGLVLDVGGYYKNVFTIAPSFYITREEMDLAVELSEKALQLALKI